MERDISAATQAPPESPLQRRSRIAAHLRRRLVAHLAAGGTTDLTDTPLEYGASAYTDPARFAAEKRELFHRLPLVAGLSGDLPNPGDVILFDLAGPPILITRDADRRVHAFLNLCPPTAAPGWSPNALPSGAWCAPSMPGPSIWTANCWPCPGRKDSVASTSPGAASPGCRSRNGTA